MEILCPHRDECGGCTSQHIDYETQLLEKQKVIETLFHPHPVEKIRSAESPWHYRGKMEFSFSEDKKGKKFLGLYKTRGRVVDLLDCKIARSPAGRLLARVRRWWEETKLQAYHGPRDAGSLQTITLRSGLNEMVILTVSGNAEFALTRSNLDLFVEAVQLEKTTSVYLLIRHIAKGRPTYYNEMHLAGPPHLEETLSGLTFHISPQAFFQPNRNVAEMMFQEAIAMLKLRGDEKVLDLYCGIGTIGMILSKYVGQVVGLEINASAVTDAKDNIERLGLENMQVYQGDAAESLQGLLQFFTSDIIILDPPRAGLDEKSKKLIAEAKPKKILYISCNPVTQARDVADLPGYAIDKIAPFDQFPHTRHIENILLLVRTP